MSWLKPVTTVFAVLTMTTLVWAAQSDEGSSDTDAPPAEVVEAPEAPQEDTDFPQDAADFPDDAAEFPGDSELLDFPEPERRRAGRGDVKGQLFQLLQREISRKMAEKKRRNYGHRGDLERALHQRLQEQMAEFNRPGGIDGTSQIEVGPGGPPFRHAPGIHGRLEHMQAAVHHLHAAEMHEIAEIVEQQADAFRRMSQAPLEQAGHKEDAVEYEEQEHHQPVPEAPRPEHLAEQQQLHGVLQELMEQVELLRDEVGELREQVGTTRQE